MTNLADLVKESLVRHAGEAPDGSGLLGSVRLRMGMRRGRQRMIVAIAAAAVVAIALVTGIVLHSGGSTPNVVPIGVDLGPTQTVSYRGLEIRVPASWKLNNARCGTPVSDTVIFTGGPVNSCLVPQPPGLTVVRLLGVSSVDEAPEDVVLDGHPARRGPGLLVVPDLKVTVRVESPDPARVDSILRTVRAVAVDSVGCEARVDRLTPDAVDAGRPLVPGRPSSAVICRYSEYRLSRSVVVPGDRVDELMRILNELVDGIGQLGDGPAAPAECEIDRQRGFVLRFGYPDQPTRLVFVHVSGCDGLYASTGTQVRKINEPLVTFLLLMAGYDTGVPDPRAIR